MGHYQELERKSLEALSYGSIYGLVQGSADVKLYISVNAAPFSSPTSYAIVCQRKKKEQDFFVLRAVWRMDLDYPRNPLDEVRLAVLNPDPTIQIQTAECSLEWANTALEPIRGLSLPLMPKHPSGLDGVTYTLRLPDFFGGIELRWWCRGPDAWAPLTGHITKLLHEMESEALKFEEGPLAFSYSVELTWKSPGLDAKDLSGVRTLIPSLSNQPVAKLLEELKGTTSLYVGTFSKNEAVLRCKMAEELDLTAVMKRTKVASHERRNLF